MLTVFEKEYDGESICDAFRDFSEAFNGDFNPIVSDIPQDQYGFQVGNFKVTITWENENEHE